LPVGYSKNVKDWAYIALANKMTVTLTILRYRKRFIPFALLSMMLFRLPLWLNKNISFYKLLGSGKNGTFDKRPDWQQWGVLSVVEGSVASGQLAIDSTELSETKRKALYRQLYGSFVAGWIRLFGCEAWTIFLEPIEGHGTWDGKKVFGELPFQTEYDGKIAVLTRATIRLSRLKNFWANVSSVANQMSNAKGLVSSLGIGEVPWIKQATFSIWEDKAAMKAFAYQMREHQEVIRKTREEKWYSEDMFVRFKIVNSIGSIRGIDPALNIEN